MDRPANEIKGVRWRAWSLVFAALVLIGVLSFIRGASGAQAQRTWQAYLINFVFWLGMGAGAMLFVAILNITNARWGRPLKRLAEALGTFLPVSFVLFWILYPGREHLFPWIREPVHGKDQWLNIPFLFARNGVGLFLLSAVAVLLLYASTRRSPVQPAPGKNPVPDPLWKLQVVLSPILGILFALVLSLVAFDLIMSLDPHWYSTLFGGYFFVGSFYLALAALALLSGLVRKTPALLHLLGPRHFHDLGKLLFGFCMMIGYLFYSQFLVIWYGNLPEETRYVIERIRQNPWAPLSWIILGICFALPFLVLLIRKLKMTPGPLMGMGGLVFVGMWLERFFLVAPSIWKGDTLPLGTIELSISAGFLGLAGLTVLFYLKRFSLTPVTDPLFQEEMVLREKEGQEDVGRQVG